MAKNEKKKNQLVPDTAAISPESNGTDLDADPSVASSRPRPARGGDDYISELAAAADQAKEQSNWMDSEYSGQLAVDVYEHGKNIVIRAAIAGVRAEDIDVSVNNDMVTIKGVRHVEDEQPDRYLYQECYWGGFSRTVILPADVRADGVNASLKNGILRVTLPKLDKPKTPPITVVDEEEPAPR